MRYVSFSGGADSTALAIYLKEKGEDFELIFSDTSAELPETYWIIPRVATALGKKIRVVSGPTFYQRLVNYGFMLPGPRVRWCTRDLKQKPINEFVRTGDECTMSIGIRADEAHRLENGPSNKPANCEYDRPLVDAGFDKREVRRLCEQYDLLSPVYRWRSNCSCFCCPFQRKADWLNLSREHPDLFALAEDWEGQSALSSVNTRLGWNEHYKLQELREADGAQFTMLKECREEACAICQW